MPVYFVRLGMDGDIKIGFAVDVIKRIRGMQTAHSRDLVVVRVLDGGPEVESALHIRFRSLRIKGEWFKFSPEMVGADLGHPDLPVPIVRRGRRGRSYANTPQGRLYEAMTQVFDLLGGKDEAAKEIGLAPWDNTIWQKPETLLSGIAVLLKHKGHTQFSYQQLVDLHRDAAMDHDRSEKASQRETRVEKELAFIRRNGRSAVWWTLAPETLTALADLAQQAAA